MHLEVSYARDLLEAHNSGKTYVERLRRLILLHGEVGEIIEDLRVSGDLFEMRESIMDGLEKIVEYLDEGRAEYKRCHSAIDSAAKKGCKLDVIIDSENMSWVYHFIKGDKPYLTRYDDNLNKSKGAMRQQVFGA